MKGSLQARLLLTALFMLSLFTGLTGLVLDKAFRESATQAQQHRLQGQLFALLAATDLTDERQLVFSRPLPDERYQRPDSGLFASVQSADGQISINSKSLLGTPSITSSMPAVGKQAFSHSQLDQLPVYVLSYTASWEIAADKYVTLYYRVAEDFSAAQNQIDEYRTNLWGWLAVSVLCLLIAQGFVLRWSLKPLRQITHELANIESGRAEYLEGQYPKELQQLSNKINDLLKHTQVQLARYRDSLGNMAHSMKTPLAILSNALSLNSNTKQDESMEQIQRIRQIVDYQLQRAATAGQSSMNKPVFFKPLTEKIIAALQKVYAEKNINSRIEIAEHIAYRADESDMLEILGNLIENAFKWSTASVRVSMQEKATTLELCIDDDGPGIAEEIRQHVLQRGNRADPTTAGHGIGLAMVHEIVLLYGGKLEISGSELGGARICVIFNNA